MSHLSKFDVKSCVYLTLSTYLSSVFVVFFFIWLKFDKAVSRPIRIFLSVY